MVVVVVGLHWNLGNTVPVRFDFLSILEKITKSEQPHQSSPGCTNIIIMELKKTGTDNAIFWPEWTAAHVRLKDSDKILVTRLKCGTVSYDVTQVWAAAWAKPTKWHVRPSKTQISLDIRPVWSESSLSVYTNIGSLTTYGAHRLIWVFTGRTFHFAGFVVRRLILCVWFSGL